MTAKAVASLGAAACIACCIGPLLAMVGGTGAVVAAGALFVSPTGALVAVAVTATALVVVRHRRSGRTCAAPTDAVPVTLTPRAPEPVGENG